MKSVGLVFPGQGSQSVGMLGDIAKEFPEVQKTFAEATKALDYDLWSLVQQGPAPELDKTVRTQPALLAASYALWRISKAKKNINPALLAGHSLGEYTALVCAEAISFPDALRLVAARGQYMQAAAPVGQGALAAIVGLDDDAVLSICEQAKLPNDILAPANFNSPGQVVIAGYTAAVERALILAKTAGARLAKLLPVSVPSHCELMKPAAEQLTKLLATIEIKTPVIPVLSNVDVTPYQNADAIRDGLIRQLFMPVRWVETMQTFAKAGIKHTIECGPGRVLTGLNKRIVPEMQLTSTGDLANLHVFLETTLETE
jgi:[acyl-carrier-protein] S-malonyltransferase